MILHVVKQDQVGTCTLIDSRVKTDNDELF